MYTEALYNPCTDGFTLFNETFLFPWKQSLFRTYIHMPPGLRSGTEEEAQPSIVYIHESQSLYLLGFPFGDRFN